MKNLNVKEVLEKDISYEIEARVLMINAQIDALERLIEQGEPSVRCPSCWNHVASLIEKLRYYAPAIWLSAEDNLSNEVMFHCKDMVTGVAPKFGDYKNYE